MYFSRCCLTVLFNKNGLEVNPKTTWVNHIVVGVSERSLIFLNQRKERRYLWSSVISISTNVCLISVTNPNFQAQNCRSMTLTQNNKHWAAVQNVKQCSPLAFYDASNTIRNFAVSLFSLIAALWGT